jgi:hypothetical protein
MTEEEQQMQERKFLLASIYLSRSGNLCEKEPGMRRRKQQRRGGGMERERERERHARIYTYIHTCGVKLGLSL